MSQATSLCAPYVNIRFISFFSCSMGSGLPQCLQVKIIPPRVLLSLLFQGTLPLIKCPLSLPSAIHSYMFTGYPFTPSPETSCVPWTISLSISLDLPSATPHTSLDALPSLLGLDSCSSVFSYTGRTLYRTSGSLVGVARCTAHTFSSRQ